MLLAGKGLDGLGLDMRFLGRKWQKIKATQYQRLDNAL
jgi:hypothetical protein